MINYYDWPGYCKVVQCGDYPILLGPNAELMSTADWWVSKTGRRPSFTAAYQVSEEFHEKYKDMFNEKGMYFDGGDGGSEL